MSDKEPQESGRRKSSLWTWTGGTGRILPPVFVLTPLLEVTPPVEERKPELLLNDPVETPRRLATVWNAER